MQNSMEYFWAKTEVECCHFPWREGTDLRPAANPPVPDLGGCGHNTPHRDIWKHASLEHYKKAPYYYT